MVQGEPSRKTILVVEDDAFQVLVKQANLEKAGYRVVSAGSGEDAVKLGAAPDSGRRPNCRQPDRYSRRRHGPAARYGCPGPAAPA